MKKETPAGKKARLAEIMAGLKQAYPTAHCELNYANPLQLLVATILSARCADKQVNKVTERLFQKYPAARDYSQVDLAELENDLKSLGMFRTKARNIQLCCRKLVLHHGGQVPDCMEDLVGLYGVGRKTANVVLGNAFGINTGVVVDTHVMRLAGRLGLSTQTNPEKIELDLMALAPQSEWTMLSHWLIWHGRRRCSARNPDCPNCEIKALCPSAGKF